MTFAPREGALRFEPNWWPASSLGGLLAALRVRPEWAFERAAVTAERCRALLGPRVEVIVPEDRSTLVSFRPEGDSAALVAHLAACGVHVREIPGSGLVRVSCGWWTSDGDLERLIAALF
jgi:L-cysteine/cystine lyase